MERFFTAMGLWRSPGLPSARQGACQDQSSWAGVDRPGVWSYSSGVEGGSDQDLTGQRLDVEIRPEVDRALEQAYSHQRK